ncbi:RHE_PE00001 family protein [Bosea sp. (in: a-proteobacteria)]|uniref:RHE_PE00001 family protein n=1 Tax=Bosea sp. (in: a-proteobacteria) TaxID=1871050 RepID=UPI002733B86F|nr:RHE_PE00001 family protein [Bosea sp. (in: a-proteobacteria)]MDP3410170.1 RHE_PE00001 family protein [Bosea sp. (in: a-proteobacteria)]
MKSISYDLSRAGRQALVCDCVAAAEAAAIALARFDERLARAEPVLAEGVRQRGHAFEAQALIGLTGGLCPLEDLVLHDAGMDVRSPTRDITRAAAMLEERRRLARREPAEILGTSALRLRLGMEGPAEPDPTERGVTTAMAPKQVAAPWDRIDPEEDDDQADEDELDREDADDSDDPAFAAIDALLARARKKLDAWNDLSSDAGRKSLTLRDPGYDTAGRFALWQSVLEEGRGLPATLAAALALDAWLWLEPSERAGELGFAFAATVLRQRGLADAHLPTLGLGLRRGKFRWSPHLALSVRIAGLLGALTEAAAFGQADLDRLSLARTVMLRKCEGRRGNSKLAELADLFVASPLVSVQLAAARLQVSPQAVEAMLKQLGGSLPRELTGRKRYRAWGIM